MAPAPIQSRQLPRPPEAGRPPPDDAFSGTSRPGKRIAPGTLDKSLNTANESKNTLDAGRASPDESAPKEPLDWGYRQWDVPGADAFADHFEKWLENNNTATNAPGVKDRKRFFSDELHLSLDTRRRAMMPRSALRQPGWNVRSISHREVLRATYSKYLITRRRQFDYTQEYHTPAPHLRLHVSLVSMYHGKQNATRD